jgi:hypothetical protein
MYISGHSEILEESIKDLDINFKNIKYEYVTNELLGTGLKYPDFPCGEFKFKNKKLQVTKRLCSILTIVDDIIVKPKMYSIAYSSHYGMFSIWHSMTFDPHKSVKEVRDEIVDHLITLARLSLRDTNISRDKPVPNIFWLGMVIHTIMDSYSPAHLLRKDTRDIDYNHLIKHYLPTNKIQVDKQMEEHLEIVKELKEKVKPIAFTIDDTDEKELEQIVKEVANKHKIAQKSGIKQLTKLAKFFYFHINKFTSFDQKRSVLLKKVEHITVPRPKHPIVNFYYYPAQKGLFHKKYDLIYYCKQLGLYEDCIQDIQFVLKLYFEVINNPKGYGEYQVNVFLNKLHTYLMKKTFAIVPSCQKFLSGLDIEAYEKLHK